MKYIYNLCNIYIFNIFLIYLYIKHNILLNYRLYMFFKKEFYYYKINYIYII